ncbi:MAG: ribosomal protein S18-alanine N-acetyltransferase [Elusimicrobiota bacterium]
MTPPEPTFRYAEHEDITDLLAIDNAWPHSPHWTRTQYETELAWERSVVLVAESEGRVRGFAVVWLIPPEAQLAAIAVRPEAAGQGLGRSLLRRIHEEARLGGCSVVTLEVSHRNAAARHLYETEGYITVGRRPTYYADGSDAVLMDLNLPAG